jgi:hypothetical protein
MSILINADGERIEFKKSHIQDDPAQFTILHWHYSQNLAAWGFLITKGDGSSYPIATQFNSLSGSQTRLSLQVTYSGTNCFYNTEYVTVENQWNLFVTQFNENAASNEFCKFFHGTMNQPAKPLAINYIDNPTGTRDSDAGKPWVVGDPIFANLHEEGKNGLFAVYNRLLNHEEILEQQHKLTPILKSVKPVIFAPLDGADTVRDISGNGFHGTVTNGTKDDPLPSPQIKPDWDFSDMHLYPTAPAAGSNIPLFMHHYKQLAGA